MFQLILMFDCLRKATETNLKAYIAGDIHANVADWVIIRE